MTVIDETHPLPERLDGIDADLGFGSLVARESRRRLLNRDGTFNVRREGLPYWQSLSAYHYLISLTWPRFLAYLAVLYVVANAFFAMVFVACGPGALSTPGAPLGGSPSLGVGARFVQAFFFSVHTFATIGYGNVAPATLGANVVVFVEALTGLITFAVVAGIVFARFARPVARVVFSRNAVIAPYRGGRALMFRIVNQRSNELVQLEAKVLFSRRRREGGSGEREFIQLELERDRVVFFPLSWTIVHPIDRDSPLQGCDERALRDSDAELLILLNGFDETFSQTVHTRSSYKADEIVWGARFASMFLPRDENGVLAVDIRKIDDLERVAV